MESARVSGNWKGEGRIVVEGFGTDELWTELEREAHELLTSGEIVTTNETGARRDGSMISPYRFVNSPGGPRLKSLHRSRKLIAIAREATGINSLIPARASYNFYRRGDFVGLHRDNVRCAITFTFPLTVGLEPMKWAPELRGATNAELVDLVSTLGLFPVGHSQFALAARQLHGFDGYNTPHWREPVGRELAILGSVCYFDL